MNRWLIAIGSALIALALTGCPSASSSCSATVPASCSTTPSYKTDVAPVLAANCTSCHSASGSEPGRPLDSYAEVQRQASAVESQMATCNMPPSGTVAATDADKVLLWIACGAPNN
jgi:uncharacterized membrane protein